MMEADCHAARGDRLAVHGLASLLRRRRWLVVGAALIDAGVASAADVDTAVRFGFGFRYAACGPIVQKEHSGWEISTALYRRVFPTLAADAAPPPSLEAMLAEGRHGMKTGCGFLAWDADRVARERDRYERALRAALDILEAEGDDDPPLPWRSDSA